MYKCENENQGGVVLPDMIDSNTPYVQLKGMVGNLYVKMIDIYRVLNDPNQQLWVLKDNGENSTYTTGISSIAIERGLNIFKDYVNIVSADHCQQGSNKLIYSVHPLEIEQEGGYIGHKRKHYRLKRKW